MSLEHVHQSHPKFLDSKNPPKIGEILGLSRKFFWKNFELGDVIGLYLFGN